MRKGQKNDDFCLFIDRKQLDAVDSAWVSGQDRKKPPAPQTNQIAGFGEQFRPLANLEKIITNILNKFKTITTTKVLIC